jgi:NADH-quinone oxidoreductase subunit M
MTMSSIGLPALNGFIGEVLILQGVFVVDRMWAAVAALGIVLGAAYMLWLYQRTMFGRVENPKNEGLPDLSWREFTTFAPLIVLAFWIGLYPAPFLTRLERSVNKVVARVNPSALSAAQLAECTTPGVATPGPTALNGPAPGGTAGLPFIEPPCAADGSTPAAAGATSPAPPGAASPAPAGASAPPPPEAPVPPGGFE